MSQTAPVGYGRYLPVAILSVTLVSILPYLKVPISNTFVAWGIQTLILTYLLQVRKPQPELGFSNLVWLHAYVAWAFVCVARGIAIAEGYWEWKAWSPRRSDSSCP